MATSEENQLQETKNSLERMQQFDASVLPRTEELGSAMSFQDAVAPANRLIDLYKQLAVGALDHFPSNVLRTIQQQANSDFNVLDSLLKFSAGSSKADRDQKIQQVRNAYPGAFEKLHPFISYSTRTATDFSRLEREARAHLQSAKDSSTALENELKKQRTEMDAALSAVRKTAEEQGVSQQAIYFKTAADEFEEEAQKWLKRTLWLVVLLATYVIVTLFLHKFSFLTPTNIHETTQLAISKILMFATLSFVVLLAAKNYLANRHNAVVNRHRQNALVTYRALVESASDTANRDIVLTKAAECIFSAQPTAFSKFEGADGGSFSLLNVPGGINSSILPNSN